MTLADGAAPASCADQPGGDFSVRVVYDVTNTFEADALKKKGAPAHARGIEKTELLVRGDMTLIRRTGTTWQKSPEQYLAWQDEGDFLSDPDLSPQEALDKSMAWKAAGKQIPMVSVPIEWVDVRAPAPRYSFRYGLDPMSPDFGERWKEQRHRWNEAQVTAALLDKQFPALASGAADGVTVSTSTFAGHDCEMLRKRNGKRVHETCYATLGGRTIVLHGMDSSANGVQSQTAVSVELGTCLPDEAFDAPGRVRFIEVSG
ncbi:MAG: hypothetical protein AAFU65_02965 [Pseudomonadota bacterium]